jgi:hypothetical protein
VEPDMAKAREALLASIGEGTAAAARILYGLYTVCTSTCATRPQPDQMNPPIPDLTVGSVFFRDPALGLCLGQATLRPKSTPI